MQVESLMFITVVMTGIAIIAAILIYDIKVGGGAINQVEFTALSAEEILEVVVGVPLNELLVAGDNIEIVIKTNDHSIASGKYVAENLDGEVKLTRASKPVSLNGLQGAKA